MADEALSEFGGVVGRVVARALSWTALATGLAVGFTLLVVTWSLSYAGAALVASLVVQAVVALVLGRFALNGLHGEWRGTVLSSAGGPWSAAAVVAGRFLALTLLWSVPLYLAGRGAPAAAGAITAAGLAVPAGRGAVALLGLSFALGMLTPPLFLIVAVSATGFGEVFSVEHWRRTFAGRRADLVVLYAVYVGAVAIVLGLAVPFVLLAGAVSWTLAAALGLVAGAFALGASLDLLGRLAGFFAFGPAEWAPADSVDAPPHEADAGDGAQEPAEPPVAAVSHPAAPPVPEPAKLVEQARARFETDPDGAMADLEDARRERAPHPAIEHALCLLKRRAGLADEAAAIARDAIPLAIARGAVSLAADMFRACWAKRAKLALDGEALHVLAATLTRHEDPTWGANTWAMAIQADPKDTRAVKGMMQAAETFLRRLDRPEDAGRLYAYLLRRCPDSPLAEYMHEGLAEARKRAVPRAQAG